MKKKILIWTLGIVTTIAMSISGVCGYILVKNYITHKNARDIYLEIAETNTDEKVNITTETNVELSYPEKQINWENLKETNKDYIGWLYFDFQSHDEKYNFTLDYPVVYEQKRNQYLKTTFDGKTNGAGCIFMDMASNPSLFGYSDMLYGHHMRDGSMFGSIKNIQEANNIEYLKDNPQYLYIYTKTACHKYILVAYEQVESSNNIAYGVASDDETYDQLKENIRGLDNYIPSNYFTWKGKPEILNLSTCDGPAGTKKRFLLHFVKTIAYEL